MMKVALFDMDGTLLDSMAQWRARAVLYAQSHGIALTDEQLKAVSQMTSFMGAQYVAKVYGLDYDVEEVTKLFMDSMIEAYRTTVTAKPYAKDYLDWLTARGVKRGIATATPRRLALPVLKRLNLLDSLDFVVTTPEERCAKDDPAFFHMMAKRLGVATQECTMYEDALYAMQTARQAGCGVIGVADPTNESMRDQIIACCDRFVYSFSELMTEN
ncbi:MAG: HAD family phosphatase [Eubacteriales bacterium]|nr:HAD family phosphatase [Eubacteriales bacterium]